MPDEQGQYPPGWVCPLCGQVYSPWIKECDKTHISPAVTTTRRIGHIYVRSDNAGRTNY